MNRQPPPTSAPQVGNHLCLWLSVFINYKTCLCNLSVCEKLQSIWLRY